MNEKHDDFQSKDADPEVVTIDGERALAEKRLVRRIDLRCASFSEFGVGTADWLMQDESPHVRSAFRLCFPSSFVDGRSLAA